MFSYAMDSGFARTMPPFTSFGEPGKVAMATMRDFSVAILLDAITHCWQLIPMIPNKLALAFEQVGQFFEKRNSLHLTQRPPFYFFLPPARSNFLFRPPTQL